jgi:TPR repeat protein
MTNNATEQETRSARPARLLQSWRRPVWAFLFAVVIILAPTPGRAGDAERAAALFKQALALREAGQALAPETLRLVEESAALGNAEAQDTLGQLYVNGSGVKRNDAEAYRWFELASKSGFALAQDHLGNMLANGISVPTNFDKAFTLFRLAAEKGLADAQFDVGQFYREGKGVSTNLDEAARWYLKAAEQGHQAAQINLAGMRADGIGGPRDVEDSYKWLTLAVQAGNPIARANRQTVAGSMTPEQILSARKKVEAYVASTNAVRSVAAPRKK